MKVCTIEGCEFRHVARGFCSKHYWQKKHAGEFDGTLREKNRTGCSVDDCDRKHYSRSYCKRHYALFMKWGESLRKPEPPICACGKPSVTSGMCKACYSNHWYHNATPVANSNRKRVEVVGYEGAHYRLRADRGKASSHNCVNCNAPAEHWSLNHDAEVLVSVKGGRVGSLYSMNIMDYSPRCRPCHNEYDKGFKKSSI